MSTLVKNYNRLAKSVAVVLGLLLCLPFVLIGIKTVRTYTDLQDIRFQGEKLLLQQQVLNRDLQIQQENLSSLQTSFKPLGGTAAQANAELQTLLLRLITSVGGNVETSSQVNNPIKSSANKLPGTPSSLRTVLTNVRWSVSEDGLAQFLAKSAEQGRNLKLDSLLIRRRQGTASLLDIRMQCSALWQDPSVTKVEARP
jgi:hypothetical protein